MALLEFANRTVPVLMKKSVNSFFAADPLLRVLLEKNQVKRTGGSSIKLVRIKSGHSALTEITSSNISVPLVKQSTTASLSGDWGKVVKPLIIPHVDRDRATSPDEAKRLVQDTVAAAMQDAKNKLMRQVYIGDQAELKAFGSLNGGISATTGFTTGTSNGLERGAIYFNTPEDQRDDAVSYLGQARLWDTENNDVDNWHNQFADAVIGTDFIEKAEEVKLMADSYADDNEGITLGVCSNADLVAIGSELRAYPAAGTQNSAIVYTTDDVAKGRVHQTLKIINGVQYYANRWMSDANMPGLKDHVYLLNPNGIEFWVNAGNNFRVTPMYDGLQTSNVDASIGFIILEAQLVVTNLMIQGATCDRA